MSVEATTAIIEHLGRQRQAMVNLLADLVNIDSGSYNKRGVDAVGDRLQAWLEAVGISCEIFPNQIFGDCMAARIPGTGGGNRPIVLMGHRDTVFPDGTAAQRPFRIDGDEAFGLGIVDTKAGLVMNTFVLEALRPESKDGQEISSDDEPAGIVDFRAVFVCCWARVRCCWAI